MSRDFNGSTDRLDWANIANLAGSAVTVSAWVYVDSFAGVNSMFISNFGPAANTNGMAFYFISNTNGQLAFYRQGTTFLFRYGDQGVAGATGRWQHVLVTHTGTFNDYTTIHIYLNGTEVTYATTGGGQNGATETALTGSWSLGGRISDDIRNFDGKIAEVGVWNTVLAGATIAALAAGATPDQYPTNLQFYYSSYTDTTTAETGGAAATVDGTTYSASNPIIHRVDNFQAQVSDAASISFSPAGGTTNITPAEGKQAQTSDAATMGVYTPITPAQNFQAQISDAAVFGTTTPIAPAQNNQAQVSDAAIPTVNTPFLVDDIILEWVAAQIDITPAQANQAQVSDAATFGVIHIITPDGGNQAQVSDAAMTSGAVSITPAQNFQAQVSDTAVLGVYTPITPAQNFQAQVSDAAGITAQAPTYTITVSDANQAQVSDACSVTFTAAGASTNITPAEANQFQVSDTASISAYYPILMVGGNQAQASDLAVLSKYTGMTPTQHGNRKLYGVGARPVYSVNPRKTGKAGD
jgi:hypothetical protein